MDGFLLLAPSEDQIQHCLLSRACLIRISVTGLSFPYATTTYMTASSKAAKESWASASLALATCSLCSSSTYFVNEDELLLSSWYVYASCKSNWWQVAGLQQPEQLHEDTLCHMQPCSRHQNGSEQPQAALVSVGRQLLQEEKT
eukprot:Em0010g967a